MPKPRLRVGGFKGVAAVATVVIVLVVVWTWWKRSGDLSISCMNHGHFIVMAMKTAYDRPEGFWEIPYLPGVEGHQMIVAYSNAEYGPTLGGFNCHHGAFGFHRGGWQAINLPQSRWIELFERWEKSPFPQRDSRRDGIPLYWCGRETGVGSRVYAGVRRAGSVCQFYDTRIEESALAERIAWLNQQLTDLGESPVAVDLPRDIDWKSVILRAQSATNSFRKNGPYRVD